MASNDTTSVLRSTVNTEDIVNTTDEGKPDIGYLPLAWITAVLIVSVVGNSLVIAAFVRDARLRVIFNLFVVHLAAADLVISFLIILALVDVVTQMSVLGSWPHVCQMCAVFANAVPVEQLILTHVICNDRHRALQRGVSYTRRTFHWHIEKLILFVTWVICFVGSFLITDLMSSIKLSGYGCCKFPGRLLYISYTSFLHFAMLVSLVLVMMCIIWDFRKRRQKCPQSERLHTEFEDDSPLCLACQTSSDSLQNTRLIPRSPAQVFRNFISLPSLESQRPTWMSTSVSSPSEIVRLEFLKTNSECSHPLPLQNPLAPDAHHSCSPTEMSLESQSHQLHDIDIFKCCQKVPGFLLNKDLVKLDDHSEDNNHRYENKDVKYEIDHDKFKLKQAINGRAGTGVKSGLQVDGPQNDTTGQAQEQGSSKKQQLRVPWPTNVDTRYRDSRGAKTVKVAAAKGEPAEAKPFVGKGTHEHHINMCISSRDVQTRQEKNKDTEERAFIESAEDMFSASFSLSDDELTDIPLLRLRPRTDSLYTLRSCLSISEESLSKITDEFMDVSSQSEGSISNETSEISAKSRRDRRNENRLFTIGDDDEEHSDMKVDNNNKVKLDSNHDTSLRFNQIPYSPVHPESRLQSISYNVINFESADVSDTIIINENDSSINKSQNMSSKKADVDKEKPCIAGIDTLVCASEFSERACSSNIQKAGKLTSHDHLVRQELSVGASSEQPHQQCLSAAANCHSESQLMNQHHENCINNMFLATHDDGEKHREQSIQITGQIEASPERGQVEVNLETEDQLGEPESPRIILNEFQNDNNSAGNSKPGDSLELSGSEKQQKDIDTSYNTPYTLIHEHGSQVLTELSNTPETTELALPEKTQEYRDLNHVPFQTYNKASRQNLMPTGSDSVRYHSRSFYTESYSIPGDSLSYVYHKGSKEYPFSETTVTCDKNYFDIISIDPSEYLDIEHSQRDLELAVESWFKFYDIQLTSPYKHYECDIISGNNLTDKMRSRQQCGSFIPQPGHSLTSNSLVRARQMWLDFYGIDMTKRNTPNLKHQPDRHLLSVPVEIHDARVDSPDGSVTNKPLSQKSQTEWNSLTFNHGFDTDNLKSTEKIKLTKRSKRVIKYKYMKEHSHSRDSTMVNSQVHLDVFENIPKDFKRSTNTTIHSQHRSAEGSCHSLDISLPNEVCQGTGFHQSRGSIINKTSSESQLKCNLVNQEQAKNDATMWCTNTANETSKANEQSSMGSVVGAARDQKMKLSTLVSNFTLATPFSSRRSIENLKEANILENTRAEQTSGNTSVESCFIPLLDGTDAVGIISNTHNIQKENLEMDMKTYSVSKSEEVAASLVAHTKDMVQLTDMDTKVEQCCGQGEIIQITYSKPHEDQIESSGDVLSRHDLNAAQSVDYTNDIDKTIVLGQKRAGIDANFVTDKSTNDFMQEKYVQVMQNENTSDKKKDITETAMTTYQILESLSITCRALLVELGLYQDILAGIIPLDKEMLCLKVKNMTSCPDCERREREKRQASGMEPDLSQKRDGASNAGPICDEMENTTGNANIHRIHSSQNTRTNNSLAFAYLNVGNVENEGRSSERSQESSLEMGMLQDMEPEASLSRTMSLTTTLRTWDYYFTRLPRRLPCQILTICGKFSFEKLKASDAELCILISLICIVLLQLICWFPITILYMVFDTTDFPPKPTCTEVAFLWLWCLRMAIQPFLYACYSKYFRESYAQLLLCHCLR